MFAIVTSDHISNYFNKGGKNGFFFYKTVFRKGYTLFNGLFKMFLMLVIIIKTLFYPANGIKVRFFLSSSADQEINHIIAAVQLCRS